MHFNRSAIWVACAILTCSLHLAAQVPATQSARTQPDAVQEFERVRTAAEQGDAKAQTSLGMMYAKGDGVGQIKRTCPVIRSRWLVTV